MAPEQTNGENPSAASDGGIAPIAGSSKGVIKQTITQVVPQLRADVDANTEAIAQIQARSEAGLRKWALAFSVYVFTLFYFTHVYYFNIGRVFTPPSPVNEIIWVCMVAPWLGFGLPRFLSLLEEFKNGLRSQEKP